MSEEAPLWRKVYYGGGILSLFCLVALSHTNYLLFHVFIELSSVAVAITIFSIGWNARHITRNNAFIQLAIAFLPIGLLDLLHTLSYNGMGIFPESGSDMPTQLWISARGMQSAAYLCAAFYLGSKAKPDAWKSLTGWLGVAVLLVIAIWPLQVFPHCYIDGQGLTPFKVGAEYLISFVLLWGAAMYWIRRRYLDKTLTKYLVISIMFIILSEMTFTLYHDIYGITNILGHLFKLGAVLLVYRALVLGAFRSPYQTLFRDLTESHVVLDEELAHRRQVEAELVSANQELDAFVRTVSHDLRSPLTVVMGNAELLLHQLSDRLAKRDLELIHNIRSQGKRMTDMLSDLLEMARIGHLNSPPEIIDSALIATQVADELLREFQGADCRIEIGPMPVLKAHSSLIYQLLANLISNAVRYAAMSDQPIKVGGTRDEREIRLFVSDHGPGIPQEMRENVFDVFYRIDDKRTEQGFGIGLATVRRIVRYYGGRVYAEETPGGGATFWVVFDRDTLLVD